MKRTVKKILKTDDSDFEEILNIKNNKKCEKSVDFLKCFLDFRYNKNADAEKTLKNLYN